DENQQLAQQLRVQSIPAVFAFKGGRPIDGFVGALPESQIKQFIQRLGGDSGPSAVEQAVEQAAAALEQGDAQGALDIYGQVLRADPSNTEALGGLILALVKLGDLDAAQETLDGLEPAQRQEPAIHKAEAALKVAQQAGDVGDLAELNTRLEADPNDHAARIELSKGLLAQGRREEAVDQLLEAIRRDRAWNDEAARKQLITLFDAFGPTDPLTVSARRRLSSILFS
ncbi:MAG TPA: tetratricopeptide repeat protein, partial [Alphaproteobacteria bacterium]|nr:tetratricopeptide repeat protein [Alphaproteobacteria bacterium]